MTQVYVYPVTGAIVRVPTATSGILPSTGALVEINDHVANLIRRGLIYPDQPTDAPATLPLAPFTAYAWTTPLGTSGSSMNNFLYCDANHTPAAEAAVSNTMTGNVAIVVVPVQDFGNRAADAPVGGPSNKNVWCTSAVSSEKARITQWISDYVAAGGREPERIAMDQEGLTSSYNTTDADLIAIWNDPRSEEWREELATYGITDLNRDLIDVPDYSVMGGRYGDYGAFLRMNSACLSVQKRALDEAYYQPFKAVWPNAQFSNYSGCITTEAELSAVRYFNARMEFQLGPIAGTHGAPEFYGDYSAAAITLYGPGGYSCARYETNRIRSMYRSAPTVPLTPWVSYGFADPYLSEREYCRELRFHLALCGADGLFYFNSGSTADLDQKFAADLNAIKARLTSTDRQCITTSITFALPYFCSGMRVGPVGSATYHWRYTIAPNITTISLNGVPRTIDTGLRGVWFSSSDPTPPTVVVA